MRSLLSEEVVLLLGFCPILFASGERVTKPIVYSYSSSNLPHPALITHHYNPPTEITTNIPEEEHEKVENKQDESPLPSQPSLDEAYIDTAKNGIPIEIDYEEETPVEETDAAYSYVDDGSYKTYPDLPDYPQINHPKKVLQQPKYFAYSTDVDEPLPEEHHQHPKNGEKYSKGGGQEHHSAHKESGGGKSEKGYKGNHKFSKSQKGHHKKEGHKGKYVDAKGKKDKKKEEGGHYGEHHHAEKGRKAAKYGESGEHKKGHSTKGEHNIHKKDEYLKKHEFYDEHHEGGEHEKHGGYHDQHSKKKGGKRKKGHHKSGSHHSKKGKKGGYKKGGKSGHHKGHKNGKGHEEHYKHYKKHGKKGGHKEGKKWGYSKGEH